MSYDARGGGLILVEKNNFFAQINIITESTALLCSF